MDCTKVKEEHDPHPRHPRIKAMGFDSVEVPIFEIADHRKPYERLAKRLQELGRGADRRDRDEAGDEPDLALPGHPQGRRGLPGDGPRSGLGVRLRDPLRPDPLGHRRLSGDGPTARRVQVRRRHAPSGRGEGRDVRIKIAVEYLNRFENTS